ncbi:MAG: hypothetical protein DRH26_01055 [Deltaproteobacteria bacterium]|nr:MAG: hypothetical protein DRH26_01055 [Deltaproteobacteria bacterium]
MAIQPLYKKYGVNADPGMALVAGQQAVGNSFKDALNSVGDLLKTQEQKYVDENTLNMQAYLKENIKAGGLGADPTDQTAIKQRFGNLINMDQINSTVSEERKLLETEAMNSAGKVGSQVLADTGDQVKARQAFTQAITDLGGSEKFKNASTEAWSNMKETIFTDIQTEKVQRQNTSLNDIQMSLAENGAGDANAKIELALQNEDPKDRAALRQNWRGAVENMAGVTKEQSARNLSYLDQQNKMDAIKGQELGEVTERLSSERAALQKNYIPEAAQNQLAANTKGFGQSMLTAVDEELGWFNSGDVANIKAMRKKLTDDGVPDPEAELIMTHVFGLVYDGGSWHGNNLSPDDITQAEVETDRLSKIYKNKSSLDSQITDAANAESRFRLQSQLDLATLQSNLTKASRNKNVMHDPSGSAGVWNKRLAKLQGNIPPQNGETNVNTSTNANHVGGYDIEVYATDPDHENKVRAIYDDLPTMDTSENVNSYIKSTSADSPITGDMVMSTAEKYDVDPKMLISMMKQDSSLGTAGKGVRTLNPGNVGNDDAGKEVTFNSWDEGVDAVGEWLSKHKVAPQKKENDPNVAAIRDATLKRMENNRKRVQQDANNNLTNLHKKTEANIPIPTDPTTGFKTKLTRSQDKPIDFVEEVGKFGDLFKSKNKKYSTKSQKDIADSLAKRIKDLSTAEQNKFIKDNKADGRMPSMVEKFLREKLKLSKVTEE